MEPDCLVALHKHGSESRRMLSATGMQSVTFLTGCVASLMALRRMLVLYARSYASPQQSNDADVFLQKAVASLGTLVFLGSAFWRTLHGVSVPDVINPYAGTLIRFAIFATAIRAMSQRQPQRGTGDQRPWK